MPSRMSPCQHKLWGTTRSLVVSPIPTSHTVAVAPGPTKVVHSHYQCRRPVSSVSLFLIIFVNITESNLCVVGMLYVEYYIPPANFAKKIEVSVTIYLITTISVFMNYEFLNSGVQPPTQTIPSQTIPSLWELTYIYLSGIASWYRTK